MLSRTTFETVVQPLYTAVCTLAFRHQNRQLQLHTARMAAFPLLKLGVLVVKQVSRPLGRRIAAAARRNKQFRTWVCVPAAQLVHRVEVSAASGTRYTATCPCYA